MIHARNVADAYPLSPMQEGLLFHSLYAPESGVYVTQVSCTLPALNVAAFRQSWQYVMDRHPILRTAFAWQSVEKPLQVVGRRVPLPLVQHDWRALGASTREAQWAAYLQADRRLGFHIARMPLMRLALFRVDRTTYQFVWSHHHVLLDGWSVALLLKDVFAYYEAFARGMCPQLAPPRPYRDYIVWLQQQDLAASERFWRRRVQAVTSPTFLGPALAGQQPASGHGTWHWQLSAAHTQALQRFAQAERLTLNTVVQGVWALLLQRYTGQRTVVFGATVAGRPARLPGAEHMIGLFINTLPLIQSPPPGQTVGTWLRALQADTVTLSDYDHTPLYEIQRWAGQGGQALFDTLLVFENYPVDTVLRAPQTRAHFHDVQTVETTNYALTVGVNIGEELDMRFDYARSQFDAHSVVQLSSHFAHLLAQVVTEPALAISALELLTAAEWARVAAWNTRPPRDTSDQPVLAWIQHQAQIRPEAVALVCEAHWLTYGMLEQRANQLAQRLVRLGVGPETRVGLSVERSLEMIVGMLGIWKAGGAYVPLDPAYPPQRLAYILADAGVDVLVTQNRIQGHLLIPAGIRCMTLEDATGAGALATAPAVTLLPEHLAYVIYTSGSTGTPKGVAVAHGPLRMHCQAMGRLYGMTPEDRALHFAALSFDAAVEQWVVPLMYGACLVLRGPAFWSPEQAVTVLTRHAITRLDVPPAYATELATWVQAQRTDMALRTWTVGGEALPGASVTLLQNACPPATLLNGYGPTEAVITPLVWVAPAAACTTAYAPIGKAVGERTTYILDAARRVVPAGVVGELYIGGTGLARGYHGQPGLTAERFAPDPFSAVPGRRLYRTGDLARWQADGTIDYVGRADLQVKIRGFRIELGEIEAVLLTHTAIAAAVVVARDARAGASQALTPAGGRASAADAAFSDQRLVAYLVPAQHALPAPGDLRQFLHQRLPDYMVPALFIRLEALPLTPNGKIDRRALPVPERWRAEPEAAYMAPRTEMQRLIASIWQDVLHVEQVGIHDNFFDLGGHSLAMTKVWYSLRTRLHQDLAMLDLFQNPTIHALATHLSREPRAPLVPQPAAAVDDKIQAGKNRLKQQLLRHQNVPPGGRADA